MQNRISRIKRNKQKGITNIQIAVSIAVVGLSIAGGLFLFKYIEDQKVKNESAELADVRSSSVSYASQHGGRFTGLTLFVACSKGFFPDGRCSGTGASTAVTNQWGGSVTLTITNLTGTNNGAAWSYPGLSSKGCINEITGMWHHAARISVGTTAVKTATTQDIDDAGIIAACNAATDDATIVWTFGSN